MNAHTPGPWNVSEPDSYRRSRATVIGDDIVLYDEPLTRETDANAHLIAAAPELYAALKLLWIDAGECADWSDEYSARIEAAIAKAEGR